MVTCVVLRLTNILNRAAGATVSLRVGYARVSTKRQNLGVQLDALSRAECDSVYVDKTNGSDISRAGLKTALRKCRSGDEFVIWRLDRLSRRLVHLVKTVEDLTDSGINVRVLSGRGTRANFSEPEGRFVLGIIASFAQLEQETTSLRTRHGIGLKVSMRVPSAESLRPAEPRRIRRHFRGASGRRDHSVQDRA